MANSFQWPEPEWALLAAAVAPTPRALDAAPIGDWSRFVGLAIEQRVFPRAWSRAAHVIPPEHAAPLQTRTRQNAEAALRNVARTVEITALLAQAGIESVVLKGPLLARRLYGDFAARVAGDIDLLVPEPRLLDAARALAAAGYRHHTELTESGVARHRKSQHDIAFAHPEDDTLLELHADLAQPHYGYQVDLERWWRARQPTAVGSGTVFVLSDEHAFIFSVIHAAKHRWHRLDLVADLAAYGLLELDWPEIKREAAQAWLIRLIEISQAITDMVFDGVEASAWAARKAVTQMIANEELGRWAGIQFELRLRPGWPDRGRYLWKRLISAKLGL